MTTKPCIATKVPGIVKCFHAKSGYGIILSLDEHEDVLVHQTGIVDSKPLGESDIVELDIMLGSRGLEAANVTVVKESQALVKRKKLLLAFTSLRSPLTYEAYPNFGSLHEDPESLHRMELLSRSLNRKELDSKENVIRFKIIDEDVSAEMSGYGSVEEPIPFVSLSNVERDVERMTDVDEMVIPDGVKSIGVVFSYPLKQNFVFELESPTGKGFTRGQLVVAIADQYKQIYREENETSTLPEESMAERSERLGAVGGCNFINRAQTDGKFGIWGHVLEDLDLTRVIFSPIDGLYYLSVDS